MIYFALSVFILAGLVLFVLLSILGAYLKCISERPDPLIERIELMTDEELREEAHRRQAV